MTNISDNFQEAFLDDLLLQAGFEEDAIWLLKEDLRPILQERIILSITNELNEEDRAHFLDLLDAEQFEELNAYLKSTIPNYEVFLMEVYAQFEDEYLENFEK